MPAHPHSLLPLALGKDGPNQRIVADLLTSVGRDSGISQRQLAIELGVALGLVNAYLKRCIKKGLIKVRKVPSRRYLYYLTPRGFAEKSRLTAEFLSWSLTYFRQARAEYASIMAAASDQGWRTVALYGASELAEIAVLCANERGIDVAGIVDDTVTKPIVLGVPVYANIVTAMSIADGWILTGIRDAQSLYDTLAAAVGPSRILVPDLLSVSGARSAAEQPK